MVDKIKLSDIAASPIVVNSGESTGKNTKKKKPNSSKSKGYLSAKSVIRINSIESEVIPEVDSPI